MSGPSKTVQRVRVEIAQLAAKLLADSSAPDYLAAKRKAAARLGVKLDRFMPTNLEIEQALMDYQRLFHHDTQRDRLLALRRTALEAMNFLSTFRPLLTGTVLTGSATENAEIILHLYSNTPHEIGLFLDSHAIPHRQCDWTVKIQAREWIEVPAYRFVAGSTDIVLVAFNNERRNITPLSPVDGKPMRRATVTELQTLLQVAG